MFFRNLFILIVLSFSSVSEAVDYPTSYSQANADFQTAVMNCLRGGLERRVIYSHTEPAGGTTRINYNCSDADPNWGWFPAYGMTLIIGSNAACSGGDVSTNTKTVEVNGQTRMYDLRECVCPDGSSEGATSGKCEQQCPNGANPDGSCKTADNADCESSGRVWVDGSCRDRCPDGTVSSPTGACPCPNIAGKQYLWVSTQECCDPELVGFTADGATTCSPEAQRCTAGLATRISGKASESWIDTCITTEGCDSGCRVTGDPEKPLCVAGTGDSWCQYVIQTGEECVCSNEPAPCPPYQEWVGAAQQCMDRCIYGRLPDLTCRSPYNCHPSAHVRPDGQCECLEEGYQYMGSLQGCIQAIPGYEYVYDNDSGTWCLGPKGQCGSGYYYDPVSGNSGTYTPAGGGSGGTSGGTGGTGTGTGGSGSGTDGGDGSGDGSGAGVGDTDQPINQDDDEDGIADKTGLPSSWGGGYGTYNGGAAVDWNLREPSSLLKTWNDTKAGVLESPIGNQFEVIRNVVSGDRCCVAPSFQIWGQRFEFDYCYFLEVIDEPFRNIFWFSWVVTGIFIVIGGRR